MRYIRNMCKIDWPDGSPHADNVIDPGHAASNGDTWVISRMQMDADGEPTGRTERVDRLTDCQVTGDEDDPVLTVVGQSEFLADRGVPEDDRTVKVRITQNPRHRR